MKLSLAILRWQQMPATSYRDAMAVLFMLLPALLVTAQESRIHADVRVDRSSIPLSGQLTLTFTVEGPRSLQVERIRTPSPSPAWAARALTDPQTTPLPPDRLRWRQTFLLEPLQTGQVALPLAPLRYRLGTGPWLEHPWQEKTIEVTTQVLDPAIAGMRGNSQIEEPPPPPAWPSAWLYAAGVALIAVLGLVAWRRAGRRERATISLPPDQWALGELERVDALNLPQTGEVEFYHRLLCDVLRRFVELRLGLPATTQTTLEFLTAARQSSQIGADAQEHLRQFLERCDLAKFARAEFGIADCQQTAVMARQFIGIWQSQTSTG